MKNDQNKASVIIKKQELNNAKSMLQKVYGQPKPVK